MTEILPDGAPPFEVSPHVAHSRKHPPGLAVLVLTEGGVAFTLYGIQSLLVLYMENDALLPGHSARIWGMSFFLPFIQSLYNAHSVAASASALMGLFLAAVYATPMLGGLIADYWLGRRRMIILGAATLIAGVFMLAVEPLFLLALFCLLLGFGFLRGLLPAQLGALYQGEDPRRADAFQFFMLGVQMAVIVSPILCSSFADRYGWAAGFLIAGIGVLAGLAVYVLGCHQLPPDPQHMQRSAANRPRLTPQETRAVLVLLALLPVLAVVSVANTEIFNGYLIWGERHYQLTFLGYEVPVSWLVSMDGLVSTGTTLLIVWFWRIWARSRTVPNEIQKMVLGGGIASVGPIFLALGSWLQPGPHQVNILWGIAFHLVNDIGFSLTYATGMALFSRAAPRAVNVTIVACYSLHLFLGNLFVGKLAGLLDFLSASSFWLLHAGLSLGATLLLWLFARFFKDVFAPPVFIRAGVDPSSI
ncbi:MFS transporter [Kozakia baliensis]|uniref:MFS transporter n=1 Tax=Kozakia baliensis TaxID=153496 RepID=A0A1D8UTN8_9PROT|nr:MFS transporter [Kozakia baliensis]AOX17011.1 hypothetical protein A0U89_07485 [Kozakia baliensis]